MNLYSEILFKDKFDTSIITTNVEKIDTDIFDTAYLSIHSYIVNICNSLYKNNQFMLFKSSANELKYINILNKLTYISTRNYNNEQKKERMKTAYNRMIDKLKAAINTCAKYIKIENHKSQLKNYFNFILNK
jgi:hypothetical protein